MTTIITRLYPDTGTAHAVQSALLAAGFPQSLIEVIADDGGQAGARLHAAGVSRQTAAAYDAALQGGRAVVVVRAPFNPIGAALNAMTIVDQTTSIPVPGADANEYVRTQPKGSYFLSILKDHPRFFSQDMSPTSTRRRGTVSAAFGIPLLSRHRATRSAIHGGGFMSTRLLPFALLTRSRTSRSATPGGGTPLSSALGLPLIARRG